MSAVHSRQKPQVSSLARETVTERIDLIGRARAQRRRSVRLGFESADRQLALRWTGSVRLLSWWQWGRLRGAAGSTA